MDPQVPAVPEGATPPAAPAPAPEVTPAPAPAADPAEVQPAGGTDGDGDQNAVPYERFKEVNEERKALFQEVTQLRDEVAEVLQALGQGAPEEPSYPAQVDPETGIQFIDPEAYAQHILGQAEERFAARQAEERSWNDATKAHPELETNTDFRELVLGAMEVERVKTGKLPNPKAVADKVSQFRNAATAAAAGNPADAAHLPQGGAPVNPATLAADDLQDRIYSSDPRVRDQAMLEYLATYT